MQSQQKDDASLDDGDDDDEDEVDDVNDLCQEQDCDEEDESDGGDVQKYHRAQVQMQKKTNGKFKTFWRFNSKAEILYFY